MKHEEESPLIEKTQIHNTGERTIEYKFKDWAGGLCTDQILYSLPPFSRTVQKIAVSFNVTDQGWGERQGQVWLALQDQNLDIVALYRPFDTVDHSWQKYETTIDDITAKEFIQKATIGTQLMLYGNVGSRKLYQLLITDLLVSVFYKPERERDREGLLSTPDIIKTIFEHSTIQDIGRGRQVCRLWADLLPQQYKIGNLHRRDMDGEDRVLYQLPTFDSFLHKIEINLEIKDQGYGDSKGRLWFTFKKHRKKENIKEKRLFAPFDIVSHSWQTHNIVIDAIHTRPLFNFIAQNNDNNNNNDSNIIIISNIQAHVGNGGGHALFIRNFSIKVHYKSTETNDTETNETETETKETETKETREMETKETRNTVHNKRERRELPPRRAKTASPFKKNKI